MMRMEFIRCSFTHCVGVYFHVTGRQLLLVARFFFSARRACAIPAVGCAHRHSECCVRAACCQWKANKEKEVSSFLRLRWCGSTAKSANITTSPLSSWCSASNHSSNTWVHRHWQRWSAENLRLASRRIAAAHWCRWPFLIFWQTQTP